MHDCRSVRYTILEIELRKDRARRRERGWRRFSGEKAKTRVTFAANNSVIHDLRPHLAGHRRTAATDVDDDGDDISIA